MSPADPDRIEKRLLLRAPQARVWRALTDAEAFGTWFRVKLQGPFIPGRRTTGTITYPGYEHLVMEVLVEQMEAERLFTFRWHPCAIDPAVDYSQEPTTRVAFHLEPAEGGTLLTLVESGFDRLPPTRRDEAFRMNDGGWTQQMQNLEHHLAG